ncbi:tetratricopeptide repeat protein [Mucilaginibacter agri]|uniref:histidine kinase n=1 Tax=Mucilaginibacter agri TaxID=2695265 RepID=A0A966DVT9_9SPHI|nr:tetratricopeptide repeat protein [Mucilaginibacter agri]NCD71797.1 tetratricopeptide repeat protein [Mucilaginibacter agri]
MDNTPENPVKQINSLLEEAYKTRIYDLKKSTQLASKALKQSREINDQLLTGNSLNQLSLFYMIMGEYKLSIDMAQEAIKRFEQLGNEHGIADAKYNIAGVYYKTDNYHLGLVYLMDCLTIYRKYHDYHNQARTQKSLGTIYEYIGDIKNAVRAYESSIEAGENVMDNNLVSNAYNPLSGIYLKQGKVQKALELIENAIELKSESGDIRGLAFSLYGRGKVYTQTGEYQKAERDFKEALVIHTRENDQLGIAMTLYKMGVLYTRMERFADAKKILNTALEHTNKYNIISTKFKSSYQLYIIYRKENNTQKSLECLELYLQYKEAVINTQTLQVIENYELITKMEALKNETRIQNEKAEILEKKELAEQTAKMKQEFLSTMSHEIRTPLNAVITITSLLSERSEPSEKDLFDSLKFASNNLLLIINDILDFTKLDADKVELENRPCDIKVLINQITRIYDKMAEEKGLGVTVKLNSDINQYYELDETKISQILGNLISNAIKYTDEGSVQLEVNKLASEDDDDILEFTIRDTGQGIPATYFDKMFQSFSQPKSITTRKQGGSGLGLAIVKKLIELHQSEIKVSSELGKGSVFQFNLKLRRSAPQAVPSVKNLADIKDCNILLAEDNMINALVARKLLSKWGITAEHAKNGLEAVAMSGLKAYDFILMDIHMPEMNGFDATAHIRNNENPNIKTPIFALTADITAEHQSEYVNYFNGFLRKPIEIDKLHAALTGVS